MPRTGDAAFWEGWRLEVVDTDGNRVDKVLAAKIEPNENPSRRPEGEDNA